MPGRFRYSPPSVDEIAVGARMHRVRVDYGISRALLATQIGLSADQIKRVEQGEVALRLGAGWSFCILTGTDPRWLAFGDPCERVALWSTQKPIASDEAELPFLRCIREVRDGNRRLHISNAPQQIDRNRLKLKKLASDGIKHYLISMPAKRAIPNWEELRLWLVDVTATPGAKTALAAKFKVKPAAVSQWLSGTTRPTADTTLRLLEWVTAEEVKQQRSAERALTRSAQKTRDRKSKHEKPHSDRNKK